MILHVGFKVGKTPFENNPPRFFPKQCKNPVTTVLCCSSPFNKKREATFYDILSLGSHENVGIDEIKKAYRRKVLQYHPDVCPPSKKEESTRMFLEIQQAYETLSDPILREKYDCELDLVGSSKKEVKPRFPKHVWEEQLLGLKRKAYLKRKMQVNVERN